MESTPRGPLRQWLVNRKLALGLLAPAWVAMAALLGGCPVYDDDSRYDCFAGQCNWYCSANIDCPANYRCDGNRCALDTPVPPSGQSCASKSDCPTGQNCGSDGRCHVGDCAATGCPSGLTCAFTGGVFSCVVPPDGGGFSGCRKNADCASLGEGAKCLSGTCTRPVDQCTDGTQCSAGQCVEGVCTPSCDASHPCPVGYGCDATKGVCTVNPTPCGGSATCAEGTTCVQEHCVEPCGEGGTCKPGLVCVDGGCMPDQRPIFTCEGDGARDKCAEGSICLHRSCYIACAADAGASACLGADTFNVCKPVSTASGTFSVCGSNSNLGTECDVTQGVGCANPKICIDGFCR